MADVEDALVLETAPAVRTAARATGLNIVKRGMGKEDSRKRLDACYLDMCKIGCAIDGEMGRRKRN